MFALIRTSSARAAIIAASICGSASPSLAQDFNAEVVVPDRGGNVSGCYRVQGSLYGPYRMTFCIGRGDSYHVTGGGLDCRAGLDWRRTRAGRIQIDLDYARCGRGAAWSGDSLSCRVTGGGAQAQIVVPDRPGGVDTLRCRYEPSERGYDPVSVTARRVS